MNLSVSLRAIRIPKSPAMHLRALAFLLTFAALAPAIRAQPSALNPSPPLSPT
ncbi:MAG: hypothetical protein H7343_13555, partial [Undibacterium sp.]|nr:hypothetical protein [Opitutaceae bacterium]